MYLGRSPRGAHHARLEHRGADLGVVRCGDVLVDQVVRPAAEARQLDRHDPPHRCVVRRRRHRCLQTRLLYAAHRARQAPAYTRRRCGVVRGVVRGERGVVHVTMFLISIYRCELGSCW